MGFGSYDESEQSNQSIDTDLNEDDSVSTRDAAHEGRVEFDNGASNDELLDRLKDIKSKE
ncbi:DUF5786 family protein [Haloarchaeobius sp. DFWS5]|uniref:DUF5786 family protein n=1 Tax=Haloarchaeobius sp. DFWS5 TaxID=3446114 RepID=UPI003EC04521